MTRKLNTYSGILLTFYLLLVIFWVVLTMSGTKNGEINYWFVLIYGFLPIIGGVFGIVLSRRWGSFKSSVGKSMIFISLGLITWGIGEAIWSYYNIFLKVEVPYPSLADASFILSWPLWSIGFITLSRATGAKFSLRNLKGKLLLFTVPVVIGFISYYLLYVVARDSTIDWTSGGLKLFFDLAYPILDAILLSLVLLIYSLSFSLLGGKFRLPVTFMVLAVVVNYFADMVFSYTTTTGTYYNGSFADLLFMTAMFVLSLGLNMMDLGDNEKKVGL